MKKNPGQLLALSLLFISGSIYAQTDSAYFDLGRIQLRKDFTQHITIKGSDLEHIPFARITDALAPWLQGTQSTRQRLVFIVDGNLVNSVDAWSIQDIEEITLIQNALTQVNGSLNNQQLVLVKTKRKQSAGKGITISGSHYLTNLDLPDVDLKSETNFYHQYHIGAWQNIGRISFGASANWLRDVSPQIKEFTDVHKPRQLNRFRFNGWFNATLAEGHTLSVGLNGVPQTISYDVSDATSQVAVRNDEAKAKSTTINPTLHLSSRIDSRLKNELDFSFFTNRSPDDTRSIINMLPPNTGQYSSHGETTSKYRNILLRDRISYTQEMGNQWQFQTAVSFTYRSIKQETNYYITQQTNGTVTGTAYGQFRFKSESYVLTPTISLSYGNAFNFTGGVSGKLKEDNTYYSDKIFPFFSTTIDLLRIGKPENPLSLKIFGSFAMPGDFADTRFQQPDLGFDADPLFTIYPEPVFSGSVLYSPRPEDPTIRSLQAGAVFSLPENKLQVSYNYDNRRYLWQYLVALAPGPWDYMVTYPDYIYTTHRLGITGTVIDKGGLRWMPGINFTGLKYKLKDETGFSYWSQTADANNGKMLWTGGLTNRLQYKRFSFGLDILYQFNEQRNNGPFTDAQKTNTFRLNSIYAGYSFKIANIKPGEVYISSRNCLQSDKANFPDNRRYYGAGFRLDL